MREVLDIDPAGSYVGRHEHAEFIGLELLHHFLAKVLGDVAVQGVGGIAFIVEVIGDLDDLGLSVAEDDAVKVFLHVEDAAEGVEFVALRHFEERLLHHFRGELLFLDGHFVEHFHVTLRQLQDAVGHGGGEEEHAALGAAGAQDELDIFDEAHVKHFVGLVEYHEADGIEFQFLAFDEVDDAAGRSHDDVRAFLQFAHLLADGGAAVDSRDPDAFAAFIGFDLFGDLEGQFAGRRQDEGLYRLLVRIVAFQDGQPEGGRFAGTGLCLPDDILVAAEQQGYGQLLDGCRYLKPFLFQGEQDILAQSQCSESFHNRVCRRKDTDNLMKHPVIAEWWLIDND